MCVKSSPVTFVGVFHENVTCFAIRDYKPDYKCRKHFWRKVGFSNSTEIKTLLQVVLYFVIKPMVSNCEVHHILNY